MADKLIEMAQLLKKNGFLDGSIAQEIAKKSPIIGQALQMLNGMLNGSASGEGGASTANSVMGVASALMGMFGGNDEKKA